MRLLHVCLFLEASILLCIPSPSTGFVLERTSKQLNQSWWCYYSLPVEGCQLKLLDLLQQIPIPILIFFIIFICVLILFFLKRRIFSALDNSQALLAPNANYSVVQFPSEVLAIKGDNVTLKCIFSIQSGQATSAKGAMSWFKGHQWIDSTADQGHRYSFFYPVTFLSSGEGSLVITNVSFEDSGTYTCQVMVWGQGEAHGNGIKLHVYARPSQPIIFLQLQSEPKPRWTLVCTTDSFYPPPVQLVWYLTGVKIASSQQNYTDPTGFHQASSLLDLANPHQRASYICSVEHPSLTEPLSVQYYYEPHLQVCLTPFAVEVLNLLKIGTIFSIAIGFLISACTSFCKSHSWRSPVGHAARSQQVWAS